MFIVLGFQVRVRKSMMKIFEKCKFLFWLFFLFLSVFFRLDMLHVTNKFCVVIPRYEKSSRFMKEGYERDFLRYLQSLLAEVERRIRRGHARLALSQAQQNAGVGTFN